MSTSSHPIPEESVSVGHIGRMNRKKFAWGIGMVLAGVALGLVGLVAYFFAGTIIGGNPFTQGYELMVGVVTLSGLGAIALGGISFALGAIIALVEFARGN